MKIDVLYSNCTVNGSCIVSKHFIFKLFVFVCFDALRPSQQSFSYVGTGLSGLNQY